MSNMVVRTNVLALNSHRNLGMVGRQQANASQRLSSGYRINSAADDAAGLGISEKMRAQIRGLDQASRNAQDGVSLIQTAEGAMSTINEMVVRIRELVVQAANDTNAHEDENRAQSDRVRIQDEINQLMDEIDATRNRTQFNTRNLIDGSLGGPVAGGFNQRAWEKAVDREMNSQAVLDAIDNAGKMAVASNTVAAGYLASANEAKVSANAALVSLQLAEGKLDTLFKALQSEELNVKEKERLLAEALEKLQGDPLVAQATAALQALISGLESSLNKVINQLTAAGLSLGEMAITADNYASISIRFNDDNGKATTMALGDIVDTLGAVTGFKSGSTFTNALEAIKSTLEKDLKVDLSSGKWNGANLNSVGSPLAEDALKEFAKQMDGTFSDAALGGIRSLIDSISANNILYLAAVTYAQEQLSVALAAFATAQSQFTAQLSVVDGDGIIGNGQNTGLREIYADLLEVYEGFRTQYETEAKKSYDPAANAARDAEQKRIEEKLRPQYTTEESEGNRLWFQVGANVDQGVRLSIEDVGTRALSRIGLEGDKADEIGDFTFDRLRTQPSENVIHGAGGEPYYDPDGGVLNVEGEEIQKFIVAIDEALAHVTGQRSKLGAMQNRLEYTMQNLDIASENLSAAESRIRDADMAKEMMRLTQSNVLQQAATAMLAQANQAPQSVLQLLG